MRLLNTDTLEFNEIYDTTIIEYVILSHRWGDEEVSFEDFVLAQQPDELIPPWQLPVVARTRQKAGYEKIKRFCLFARENGFALCWVDTCCIDKRSSAELSEAINSMWKWYRDSNSCCVYLADVPALAVGSEAVNEGFASSSWFKRCWTLQELLAPKRLVFCTQAWEESGSITKVSSRFKGWRGRPSGIILQVSEVTSIPAKALRYYDKVPRMSVAQRLSWAAGRQATRIEDVAYSLLGLFDINMPLLYGEGTKAFTRLQHQIIRQSSDDSIFAWRIPHKSFCSIVDSAQEECSDNCKRLSLLAPHPDYFARSSSIVWEHRSGVPYNITNYGLEYKVNCETVHDGVVDHASGVYLFTLDCQELTKDGLRRCQIAVSGCPDTDDTGLDDYVVADNRAHCCDWDEKLREFYPEHKRRKVRYKQFYLPIR